MLHQAKFDHNEQMSVIFDNNTQYTSNLLNPQQKINFSWEMSFVIVNKLSILMCMKCRLFSNIFGGCDVCGRHVKCYAQVRYSSSDSVSTIINLRISCNRVLYEFDKQQVTMTRITKLL